MLKIEEYVSLASYTTLKIGGVARYFCRVIELRELKEAVLFAEERNIPFFVLGGGSNVLISDSGFSGLVIKMDIFGLESEEKGSSVSLFVGGGEAWDFLVRTSIERGLFGLENLSGIPGTVGASPIQNIGAYGVEVKDSISWVEVFDTETKTFKKLSNKDCTFSYRDSIFKKKVGKKYIVVRVCFTLSKKGKVKMDYKDVALYFEKKGVKEPTLEMMRFAILEIRSQKFPDLSRMGTAGSFFKNPILLKKEAFALKKKYSELPTYPFGRGKVKISLAWILDHICHLKGFSKGNVFLFENQPLVLGTHRGTKAEEVVSFAKDISHLVKEKTGIEIEPEVQFV